MFDWCVLYLQQEVRMPHELAALGYSACAGAMAVMRFAGDSVRNRFGALVASGTEPEEFWDGTWNGNQGVLDERFTYSDGTTERRVWRLTKHENGRYTGTADDVVGTANGQTRGNAFRWNYTLALPVDGKVYNVDLDDWMYLIDDRVMLNRATMSKFGVRLGEITLSFTKRAP